MKQTVLTFIRPTIAALALALVVTAGSSIASAWTGPSGAFPQGNVAAPLNTSPTDQTKIGNLGTLKSFIAGDSIGAGSMILGNKGVFGCQGTTCWNTNYAASNTDKFKAGVFNTSGGITQGAAISQSGAVSLGKLVAGALLPTKGLFIGNVQGVDVATFFGKLGIKLDGTGSVGRNALDIFVSADNVANTSGAVLMTNADKFSLFNSAGTDRVSLAVKNADISGGIKISGAGTPGPNKILTSVDNTGIGMWMDPVAQSSVTTDGLIRYVRSYTTVGGTSAYCGGNSPSDDANWMLIGGGGECKYGIKTSQPVINRSDATHGSSGGTQTISTTAAIGWNIECLTATSPGGIQTVGVGLSTTQSGPNRAEAICMKKGINLLTANSSGTGVVTGGTPTGGTQAPATTWHPVPNAVADSTTVQSCQAWLAGNSSIPNTFDGSDASNYGTVLTDAQGNYLGFGTPASPISTTCAYKAVVGNITYCDGILAINPTTSINGISGFKPVKTCTGRVPFGTGWGQTNDITVKTYIKY